MRATKVEVVRLTVLRLWGMRCSLCRCPEPVSYPFTTCLSGVMASPHFVKKLVQHNLGTRSSSAFIKEYVCSQATVDRYIDRGRLASKVLPKICRQGSVV
jgi:hypothetical protein